MRTFSPRATAVTLAVAAVLFGRACGSNDDKNASTTTTAAAAVAKLGAIQSDYKLVVDRDSVAAGRLRVTVTNTGAVEHELVAFRTDLDETQLPLADGRVDEEGSGITHIDPEAEGVKPGKSKTVEMNLTAGRYVFICNLPGHYQLGMHAVVTAA
jgi:uncharacterized cupredoxin-like copper-binding protein